jgi:hypothetical protein
MLPIALQIRTIHEAMRPGFDSAVGWSGRSFAALALGGGLSAFAVMATFGPPTRALRAGEIPASYHETLVEAGVLEPDERIQFFYSRGLLSILDGGNLFTDTRVVSYESAGGEISVVSVSYPEILDLQVAYSESFLDDTVLTITTMRGEEFFLIVSAEDGRDREFVSELRARLPARRRQ